MQAAMSRQIETLIGHTATATGGRLRVKSIRVNPVRGGTVGAARTIACDAVLMCGGWTPSLHLFSHTKGSLDWDAHGQSLPSRPQDRGRAYRRRGSRAVGHRLGAWKTAPKQAPMRCAIWAARPGAATYAVDR